LEGERSGLFFEVLRLIDECKPAFVFLENVPAIRTRGAERVCKELAIRGYDLRWDVVSVAEVGAPHLRKRWFLLAAHTERIEGGDKRGRVSGSHREGSAKLGHDGRKESMADALCEGLERQWEKPFRVVSELKNSSDLCGWTTESSILRVAHGIPNRVDRLRGLGNSVCPAQAREAFMRLSGISGIDTQCL